MLKVALGAALMAGAGGVARADFTVLNSADKYVWVTVYDARELGRGARCIAPGASSQYQGAANAQGVVLYIRGELKMSGSCGGRTLSDTGRGSPITIGANTLQEFRSTYDHLSLR